MLYHIYTLFVSVGIVTIRGYAILLYTLYKEQSMAAVQMNTRIDEALKADGDAAFAEFGYSPSEAVRLLWGFAARNRGDRRKMADMIRQLKSPREAEAEQATEDQRQAEAKRWLDEWDSSWQGFFDSTGCNPEHYQPPSSKDVDEALAAMLDEDRERVEMGLSREEYDRVLFERWRAEA